MSKVNALEQGLLELLFTNVDTAFDNVGDATGIVASSGAGSLYIALFTATPGETGSSTNEADYTGYARVAVGRSGSNWTVSADDPDYQVTNDNEIAFAQCTGGSNSITHFAICKAGAASTDDMLYYGALDTSRTVDNGVTPKFAIGAIVVKEG